MPDPADPSATARLVAASRIGFKWIAAPAGVDAAAAFEPTAPALLLVEGVASYVDAATLRDVLCDLLSIAAPGTRVALSLGRSGADPQVRARLDAAVAALGEPAIGSSTAEDVPASLAECRWPPVELTERSASAGIVVAAPAFSPLPGRGGRAPGRAAEEGVPPDARPRRACPSSARRGSASGAHRVEPPAARPSSARVLPADRPPG